MTTTEQLKIVYTLPLEWGKLSHKNILIVGASGLIGSALVKALLYNPNIDYLIYAASRSIERLERVFANDKSSHLKLIQLDITDPLISDIHFHYIIDCASNAGPKYFSKYPVETILGNIYGVNNLLAYGVKHDLERFMYISSGEVYGEGSDMPYKEEESFYIDPLNVRSCYPISKRAAENLCVCYGKEFNVDVVIARPCHIYGPGFLPSDDRAYAQFLSMAATKKNIILKSLGLLERSWCYVVDCIVGLLYILLRGSNGEAYNIADAPMTIRALAEAIGNIAGVEVKLEVENDAPTPIISKGVLSSDKLKSLGWKPISSVESNLRCALEELEMYSQNSSEEN